MVPRICFASLFRIKTSWGGTKEIRLTPQRSHHWEAQSLSDDSNFHWGNRSAGCFFHGWKGSFRFIQKTKVQNWQSSADQNTALIRLFHSTTSYYECCNANSWSLTHSRHYTFFKRRSFEMNDHWIRLLGLLSPLLAHLISICFTLSL